MTARALAVVRSSDTGVPAHPFLAARARLSSDVGRLAALSALAIALAAVPVARADSAGAGLSGAADPFAAVPVYGPGDLADMRGRFTAGGFVMDLGANVRTFLDGVPVLETVVSLGDDGFVSHGTIPAGASPSPPPGLKLVTGGGPGPSIVDLTPPGFDLSAFAAADGVALTDDTGFVAMLHRVASDQILNVIVTSGSERIVRQELEVTVTIHNFTAMRRAARTGLLAGRLAPAVR